MFGNRAWSKTGLIVSPPSSGLWRSHAMLPTPLCLPGRIRVFFSGCDADLRGRIFYADIRDHPPFDTLEICERPVLDIGGPADFDADGVNPSCVALDGDVLRLYYVGWQRGTSAAPYRLTSGLAVSYDEGVSFRRAKAPLLSLSEGERYFRTAPFVWREEGLWYMLYIGGGEFIRGPDGKILPLYSLRMMSSYDGLCWPDKGRQLIGPNLAKGEIGFGRPVLWRDGRGVRKLLISIRTFAGYRMVEASWEDAQKGVLNIHHVLDPGPEVWDSEMTCFGAPSRIPGWDLLFYNGNQFGRTGFGLVVCQSDVA